MWSRQCATLLMTKTTLRNSIEKEESAYDSLRGAANAANDLRNAEERAAVRLEVRSIGLPQPVRHSPPLPA